MILSEDVNEGAGLVYITNVEDNCVVSKWHVQLNFRTRSGLEVTGYALPQEVQTTKMGSEEHQLDLSHRLAN